KLCLPLLYGQTVLRFLVLTVLLAVGTGMAMPTSASAHPGHTAMAHSAVAHSAMVHSPSGIVTAISHADASQAAVSGTEVRSHTAPAAPHLADWTCSEPGCWSAGHCAAFS